MNEKYSEFAWHIGITSSAGVVARESHVERGDERDERAARVIADRALGLAGRARGVHQRPGVLGLHDDRGRRWPAARRSAPRTTASQPARARVAEMDEAARRRCRARSRIGSTRSTSSSCTMNARASQCVGDVLDLGGDQAEVDRHRDEPGRGERHVDLHPLHAVVGEERDAVALDEAERRAARWRAGSRARSTARR